MGGPLKALRSVVIDLSPLRESVAYRALWVGQVTSFIGTQMRLVAVPWQVFRLTGSTAMVGAIGLVELIPLVVFSLVGGAIADKADRRRLVIRLQTAMMITSGGFVLVSLQDRPSVLWLFLLTGVSSALSSMERPVRTAMIPDLVGMERIAAAMAVRQLAFQVTAILGPALGGILIAAWDVTWVYVIDALSFVAALTAMRWIPELPRHKLDEDSNWGAIKDGLRFAFRTPVLRSILVIDFVAMIFGMPRAVFPALAEEVFGIGAEGLGLLFAAPAIGALIGVLFTGWVPTVKRQGLAVLVSVGVWGVAIALAGLSTFSLALTVFFLAVAGSADVVSAIFRSTMLQEVTPAPLRGRINAVNLLVVAGGPRAGDFEAGAVAAVTSPQASVVIGGVLCVVGALLLAVPPTLRGQRAMPAVSDSKRPLPESG
jgi:MFS family permease